MFFVVDLNSGQKYGPTDLEGLVGWVNEGRVLPNTIIEDTATMVQVPANQIPGLFPQVQAPPSVQPMGGPPAPTGGGWTGAPPTAPQQGHAPGSQPSDFVQYPRYGSMVTDSGDKDITSAYVLGALGLFGCCFSPASLYYASQAQKKGHPSAKTALIVAWIGTGLFALWMIGGWIVDLMF